jgi:SAM-dependent methyltransferase
MENDRSATANRTCVSCGGSPRLLFRARDLNLEISQEWFSYYRCPSCKTVQLIPVPADLSRNYTDKYGLYKLPRTESELRIKAEACRPRMKLVQRFVPSGRLLEVGASYGAFAYLAKQAGYDVHAMEMDAGCCQFMESLGIRTIHGCTPASVSESYDVIALWHSLEHLDDYPRALRDLVQHLLPGGILVLSTPNPASLQFRLFGRFWVNVDAPRHLVLVPLPALESVLREQGLGLEYGSAVDKESRDFSAWSWGASLENMFAASGFEPRLPARTLLRDGKPLRATQRVAGKLLAAGLSGALRVALFPFERSGLRGASYSAVFRLGAEPRGDAQRQGSAQS